MSAYPHINAYVERVLEIALPVLATPPPWYGHYQFVLAEVKAHALRWQQSIQWHVEQVIVDAEKTKLRVSKLQAVLQEYDQHLQAHACDELTHKRKRHIEEKVQQHVDSFLEVWQPTVELLEDFHSQVQVDFDVLNKGVEMGWGDFPQSVVAHVHAQRELLDLLTNIYFLKGVVSVANPNSSTRP